MAKEKCFACDKPLGKNPHLADTREPCFVSVGRECAKLINKAGDLGYQPPLGGPRLYPMPKNWETTEAGKWIIAQRTK